MKKQTTLQKRSSYIPSWVFSLYFSQIPFSVQAVNIEDEDADENEYEDKYILYKNNLNL